MSSVPVCERFGETQTFQPPLCPRGFVCIYVCVCVAARRATNHILSSARMSPWRTPHKDEEVGANKGPSLDYFISLLRFMFILNLDIINNIIHQVTVPVRASDYNFMKLFDSNLVGAFGVRCVLPSSELMSLRLAILPVEVIF